LAVEAFFWAFLAFFFPNSIFFPFSIFVSFSFSFLGSVILSNSSFPFYSSSILPSA